MSYREALQDTLAAEHGALYVLAALAGQTSQTSSPTLFGDLDAAYLTHRARRDRLVSVLRSEGTEPVAAEPVYDVPADLSSPTAVAAEALRLERACARTYAWLVENSPSSERLWAVEALDETAVRELAFRGTPEMLPGEGEYANR